MTLHYEIDDLPNYHLATVLDESFVLRPVHRKISEEFSLAYGADWPKLSPASKRAYKPLRVAHLQCAGLPLDYDSLVADGQKAARMAVLASWFDRSRTNILVTSIDNLITALYMWVEEYEKASNYSRGFYFNRDPKTKYEMVRMSLGPPKQPTEPSKTAIHAPRSTTKTVTMIRQLMKMIAIVRPYSSMLLSEFNEPRTKEEISHIRDDVENNELIYRDWGGAGKLFPKNSRNGKSWSGTVLDFNHLPGNRIQGYSVVSAQRGRHPILGVIDDPEDEKSIANAEFRRKFLQNLFGRYLGMFYKGGHIVWMGTTIRGSCLAIALRAILNRPEDNGDEIADMLDTRFDDWHKFRIGMIRERADGSMESIMPDHMTLDGYEVATRARGRVVMSAEADGEPLAQGEYALLRDPWRHGYMHCERITLGHKEEYFLDLATGQTMPWQTFLDSLYVAVGCDIADSLQTDADLGASVCVGADPNGKIYVLDAYLKRLIADDWPEQAFQMAVTWGGERAGFETGTMQRVVYRMAVRLQKEYEQRGEAPPKPVPIANGNQKKHQRVLGTLRPLYRKNLIAFPHFEEIATETVVHHPVAHPNRRSFYELYRELDTYTDEGPSGHDDGPDALQIAIRVLGHRRGRGMTIEDPRDEMMRRFDRIGFSVTPALIPEALWTEEMKKQVDGYGFELDDKDRMRMAAALSGSSRREFHDPYD